MPQGTHVYMVQMDIPAEHEAEFNRIYDTEHVPALTKVPGVRACSPASISRLARTASISIPKSMRHATSSTPIRATRSRIAAQRFGDPNKARSSK